MPVQSVGRTLFFFEKPSAMRQLQRFFKSPSTVCVAAEGHLLAAEEPGSIRAEWKPWRFDALPIMLDTIPTGYGENRSGQSHQAKVEAIRQALDGVERVIIATDPGREGSMIAWEVLEFLGWRGRIDRLKLGALDDLSIRRAFAAMAKEPGSGERDYAAYLEALCRQYEDYHLGLNGTRAISLRLRPSAFREPWRFGGVQTPTLAILADLEKRICEFVPQDFFKVALPVVTKGGAKLTLWHAPKERILDEGMAETIREAAARWSGQLGVEQKDVRRSPPKLFSKDALARRCAKRFGWDPQQTAKLAQDLYDQGYLSYPRTESEHLPESQTGDAAAVLTSVTSVLTDCTSLAPDTGELVFRRGLKGHYVKDPGEHHAIVPLRKVPPRIGLAPDLFRLWELVAKAFLAAHMPDGVDARTSVSAQVATLLGSKRFSVSGSVVKVPGWRAIYGGEAEADADVVPGKAKREDEATVTRLPPVSDRENAKATGAEIVTAVTEPPRRITRGELPVVMGRLIDQVEDPEVKRALENPANPNEPKGLGTAATRDTMLPKLLKSHYIALLKGKDPAIEVTGVGLAFIAAVRRVFPAYGDPVGRAVFEAELAEIGRASTRAEALKRADMFRQRTRTRVDELIQAISRSNVIEFDPGTLPPGAGGQQQAPTAAMITFANTLAERKGLTLPRGLETDSGICRAFLNEHAGPRSPQSGPETASGGPRPPSAAMVRFAQSLAQQLGIPCPAEAETSFTDCRGFLDAHTSASSGKGSTKAPEPVRKKRGLASAAANKAPAVKRTRKASTVSHARG